MVAVGLAKRERDCCVATVKTHASAKPVLNSYRASGLALWRMPRSPWTKSSPTLTQPF